MSDFQSQAERRLIDEAVAAGMVRRIPYGKTSYSISEGIYIGPGMPRTILRKKRVAIKRRAMVRRLYQDGHSVEVLAEMLNASPHTCANDLRGMGLLVDGSSTARRVEVRKLHLAGWPVKEIVAKLRSTYETIKRDHGELGGAGARDGDGP